MVEQLSRAMVGNLFVGEEPVAVNTDSFALSTQKNTGDAFSNGAPLPVFGESPVSIKVPDGAFAGAGVGEGSDVAISMHATAWSNNPYEFAPPPNATGDENINASFIIGSDVLSLEFDSGDGAMQIFGLEQPFELSLVGYLFTQSKPA